LRRTPVGRLIRADSKAGDLVGIIADVRSGLGPDATIRAVARELMNRGIRTPSGKTEWQPVQVQRVIDRAGSIAV
jgi:hypothetical protein